MIPNHVLPKLSELDLMFARAEKEAEARGR